MFDNYILLIKQFYRLPTLSFSISPSFIHPITSPGSPCQEGSRDGKDRVRIRAQRDLGIPLWLSPFLFLTRKWSGEVKGCVQRVGSKVSFNGCCDDGLNVHCRTGSLSLDGGP